MESRVSTTAFELAYEVLMDNLSPAINKTEEKRFTNIRESTQLARRGNTHSHQEKD